MVQALAEVADPQLPETVELLPESSGVIATYATPADVAAPSTAALPVKDEPLVAAAAMMPEKPMPAAFAAAAAPAGTALPGVKASETAAAAPVQVAAFQPAVMPAAPATPDNPRPHLDGLISRYSELYEVPEVLVRHVIKRESNYRPQAYHKGNWGLMQIRHATARGMGYDGPAQGLLDAETNLKYAVKYLRGAYIVAGRDHKRADWLYRTGYYYDAKRAGLLEELGMGSDRVRKRRSTN